MSKQQNVILDPYFRLMDEVFAPEDKERLYGMANIIWGKDEPMPEDAFLAALPDAEVIMCGDWRYGDVLPQAKNLRAIIALSGAFPLELDYEYCHQNYIRVLSVAGAFARQVAEHALGMAICCGRDIAWNDRAFRTGDEVYLHESNANSYMLFDQPVGMIGYGGLARALHPLLTPFNVKIGVYDPWLGEGYLRRQGVMPMSLEAVLRTSKYIFVLAAPTVENRAMLGREELAMIQKNATLLLISRAHVVDFDALTDLVLAGRFKLATDVFPEEPLPVDHPIRQAENALLSAHRAGSLQEGLWEIGEMAVDDLEVILQGLPPRRLLNAEPELSQRYASIGKSKIDQEE